MEEAGGTLSCQFGIGINWYLNPMTRVSGNYVWSDRIGVGEMNAWLMRFWLYF